MLGGIVLDEEAGRYGRRRTGSKDEVCVLRRGAIKWIFLALAVIACFGGVLWLNSVFEISFIRKGQATAHRRAEADNAVLQYKLQMARTNLHSHLVAEMVEKAQAEMHKSEALDQLLDALENHNITVSTVFGSLEKTVSDVVITPIQNTLINTPTFDNTAFEAIVQTAHKEFLAKLEKFHGVLQNASWPLKDGLEQSFDHIVTDEENRGTTAEARLQEVVEDVLEEEIESVAANERVEEHAAESENYSLEEKTSLLIKFFRVLSRRIEQMRRYDQSLAGLQGKPLEDSTILKLEIMLDMISNGWELCAWEGEMCECDTEVVYGHGLLIPSTRPLFSEAKRGNQLCSAANFGDPAPGLPKHCECQIADKGRGWILQEVSEALKELVEAGEVPPPPEADRGFKAYLMGLLSASGRSQLGKVDCIAIPSCACAPEDHSCHPILDLATQRCLPNAAGPPCTEYVGRPLERDTKEVQKRVQDNLNELMEISNLAQRMNGGDSEIESVYSEVLTKIGEEKIPAMWLFSEHEEGGPSIEQAEGQMAEADRLLDPKARAEKLEKQKQYYKNHPRTRDPKDGKSQQELLQEWVTASFEQLRAGTLSKDEMYAQVMELYNSGKMTREDMEQLRGVLNSFEPPNVKKGVPFSDPAKPREQQTRWADEQKADEPTPSVADMMTKLREAQEKLSKIREQQRLGANPLEIYQNLQKEEDARKAAEAHPEAGAAHPESPKKQLTPEDQLQQQHELSKLGLTNADLASLNPQQRQELIQSKFQALPLPMQQELLEQQQLHHFGYTRAQIAPLNAQQRQQLIQQHAATQQQQQYLEQQQQLAAQQQAQQQAYQQQMMNNPYARNQPHMNIPQLDPALREQYQQYQQQQQMLRHQQHLQEEQRQERQPHRQHQQPDQQQARQQQPGAQQQAPQKLARRRVEQAPAQTGQQGQQVAEAQAQPRQQHPPL